MSHTLRHYVDLIVVLTHKELEVRYKSSYLGYLWSLAHPLAYALVFFLVFKVFMRIEMENYALFLIAGLFPWQWFSNSTVFSPRLFINNDSIIKKVNFPRSTIPFSAVFQDMIHFVLSIFVIMVFLFVYGKAPSLAWVYGVPLLLVVQFLMAWGLALALSSMNVFLRDIERLSAILVTLLFYCTPVLYPAAMVPEKYKLILYLNPVTPVILAWRELFLNGTLDPWYLLTAGAYAVIIWGVGFSVFRSLSWKFAEAL